MSDTQGLQQTEFGKTMDVLSKAIANLKQVTYNLEERLEVVMIPEHKTPKSVRPDSDQTAHSGLIRTLVETTDDILEITSKLHNIIDRLEV